MTEARALAEQVLKALGEHPMDFGGYIANERWGKEECIQAILPIIAQAQRETWEQAALLGQEMIDAYPVDVFIEPPKGQHGETIDACSARAGRHLGKVFRDRCRQQAQEVGR